MLEDGNWTSEYEIVVNHFIKYFEDFLGCKAITSVNIDLKIIEIGECLNSTLQLALLKPLTKDETKQAVFSVPS